ncbi:general stress protein [Microbacterium sp. B35-30]|uniref:general stress protein n=1 Tax=Microbacterium sp. B35-30 TaxID=1962642 RepID=UPI001EF901AA|nr:general stress protein [Microbacterium sp. B35-30]
MTMMGGRSAQGSDAVGQAVASFPTYEAAQKAVSSLIAADIPARDIAIVGQGLRSIERITGRLGYASAARSGAVNGLLLGLLFSAILVIGSPSVPIQAFVGVLFVGIAIGMLLSIVTYSFVRRRRDYASVMQVVADHYEITVTDKSMYRARQVLGPQAPTAPAASAPAAARAASPAPADPATPAAPAQPSPPEPPKYGERVAPTTDAAAEAAPTDPGRADTTDPLPATAPDPAPADTGADRADASNEPRGEDGDRA